MLMRRRETVSLVMLLLFSRAGVCAYGQQANLLPNPSFEMGSGMPDGWALSAPRAGTWASGGRDGEKCLSINGTGEDDAWWSPEPAVSLRAGGVYHTSFWMRRASGGSGCAITGLNQVNRDFVPDTQWTQREFFFRTPTGKQSDALHRATICVCRAPVGPSWACSG